MANLDHPETVVPALQDLGRKQSASGTRDAHDGPVGAALLWTLEQGLGADFTPEVREAWTETYALVAPAMKAAAADAA